MQDPKEILAVLSDALNGRPVQWQTADGSWRDSTPDDPLKAVYDVALWAVNQKPVRIKPAATWRPWTGDEIPIGITIRYKERHCDEHIITSVQRTVCKAFICSNYWVTTDELFNKFELLDGTPCGRVKEEA